MGEKIIFSVFRIFSLAQVLSEKQKYFLIPEGDPV